MSVYQRILSKSEFTAPESWIKIKTIDMHTCGEPLRVIVDGYPPLEGNSVLEYRAFIRNHHDHLRTALMFEPRGHADMYGCILTPPNDASGDFGIVFMHNEGYSTMCGHAVIAISTLAVEMDWIEKREGEITIEIDAPCGRIRSFVEIKDGQVEAVKFHCVPSFVIGLDREIEIEPHGKIVYDLAYGGAFYAYVDLAKNNLDLSLSAKDYRSLIDLGMNIKREVISSSKDINHPFEDELSFLYGTIFIGESQDKNNDSRNVCIFAEGEVDRCPTGSGVSGRMAIHSMRNEINFGQLMKIESIIDTVFTGTIVDKVTYGPYPAVIPEVTGTANIVGKHEFLIDPSDPLAKGFILR